MLYRKICFPPGYISMNPYFSLYLAVPDFDGAQGEIRRTQFWLSIVNKDPAKSITKGQIGQVFLATRHACSSFTCFIYFASDDFTKFRSCRTNHEGRSVITAVPTLHLISTGVIHFQIHAIMEGQCSHCICEEGKLKKPLWFVCR